jgi:phage shock protein B
MDGWMIAFFVPMVIFMTIVAPVWIFMHYRSKQRAQGALSDGERLELDTLAVHADRMMDRVDTLESILDSETPGWRKRMQSEQ